MKKYGRHCLRRCLSVLLAVVMVCAAAQTLVFAVDLSSDDITPGWHAGSARARYTTSGTLEITFPESTKSDATYYAEFYDLDGENREEPVGNAVPLTTTRTYADDTTLVSAVLDRDWVESSGLDMSHRISVAITAVKDGWRSEAIEALIGESLDVPQAGSSPDGTDLYASLARFEETSPDNTLEEGGASYNGAPYWSYDKGSNGIGAMDINGVFADDMDSPYEYPGFDGSTAFRLYLNGSDQSTGEDERFDVMYRQDHWKFAGAEDLWIWVDTSFVEFDEFAIQVHYMDYTGRMTWDSVDKYKDSQSHSLQTKYSDDAYSTIGYAKAKGGEPVPVYYLNEDGLWDVMYTNENGYLENFGHYRGFLRVPVDKLWNENDNVTYKTLKDERPHSYEVWIQSDWPLNRWEMRLGSAEDLYIAENKSYSWESWTNAFGGNETFYFDKDKFNQSMVEHDHVGLSVVPIEDIASVGITWNGASADSMNKPFYIDQIGFSGSSLQTNAVDNDPNPVKTLDDYAMVPNDSDAVNQLIEKYIPNPEVVSVSDSGIVEDLEAICDQLKLTYPEKLRVARERLNDILSGATDSVEYVSRQLDSADSLSSDDIIDLYTIYCSFTLGEIHRLGLENERKLLELYEQKGFNEWFPNDSLNDIYYLPFNDVESGYSVGQSALHEYDDYNLTPEGKVHYFDRGHILDWGNSDVDMTQAWENTENLLAYSRMGYNDERNGTMQRFGYGITTIGQNGFANSRSIDTELYRETLSSGSNVENYRISLTYNGDSKDRWYDLEKGNFSGAEYFTFYADFSNVKDIRKLWITIRTGDGTIYSNDETDSVWSYDVFNLNAPENGWYPLSSDNDGCLNTGLVGFRGFIRIPVSYFNEIGGDRILTNDLSSVGQVKVFLSGNPGGNDEAGSSFVLDMFGFISSEQEYNFTQTLEQQYHQIVDLPDPDNNAKELFGTALEALFANEITDLDNSTITLFDRKAELNDVSAYDQLIEAYNTMTLTEKKQADKDLSAASGGAYTGVDELQLFVKNYDEWGGTLGNLQRNAIEAVTLRTNVDTAFNSPADTPLDTAPVVLILKTYAGYPDYYKYSVQTYWPDRNLRAVFPNYHPEEEFVGSSEDDPVKLKLSSDGATYTGTFTFLYEGAVAEGYGINFSNLPKTLTLTTTDNQSIQVSVVWNTEAVEHGEGKNLTATFSVAEAAVTHAGTYNGDFTINIDKAADTGTNQSGNSNPVTNAADYRKSGIIVYVQLVSEASYTVVIPADTSIEWGANSTQVGNVHLDEATLNLPAGAAVDVSISHDGNLTLTEQNYTIPYSLNGAFADNGSCVLDESNPNSGDFSVDITDEQWRQAPMISADYKDTLTFTATYRESN